MSKVKVHQCMQAEAIRRLNVTYETTVRHMVYTKYWHIICKSVKIIQTYEQFRAQHTKTHF